jgi:hypothetical protein
MTPSQSRSGPGPLVVAIPVRDEAERIGACLTALAQQNEVRQAVHIVLLVNNTTDGSAAVARATPMPAGTTLHVLERSLPPGQANAGYARRLAMQEAARLAGPDGVLLTTDADGRADADWLAANLAALDAGADAVAGWVDLDPTEWSRIPLPLHEADARECAYDGLCDEIHARLDPDPHDPMPRHTQHSGASIAVTARAYRGAGGIPAVASGEDRAFLAALRRNDARIRHAPGCHVTVSGRIVGRAAGGMADTIRRRLLTPDEFLDDRLEPAVHCARRAALRRRFRAAFDDGWVGDDLAAAVGLDRPLLATLLAQGTFGSAWADIEACSPVLRRRRVAVADLPAQMARATEICAALRAAHADAAPASMSFLQGIS